MSGTVVSRQLALTKKNTSFGIRGVGIVLVGVRAILHRLFAYGFWLRQTIVFIALVICSSLLSGATIYAQSEHLAPSNILVMDIDSTYFPRVSVSALSTDLPMDMLRLPIQVVEISDNRKKVIRNLQQYPDYTGAKRIFIINSEKLEQSGASGRSHRANIESIVREIYDHPTVFSNDDWMSAYALIGNRSTSLIAEWNRDKSAYFIDLVTFDFDRIRDTVPRNISNGLSASTVNRKSVNAGSTSAVDPAILELFRQESDDTLDGDDLSLTVGLRPVQIPEGNTSFAGGDLGAVFRSFSTLPPKTLFVKSVTIFADSTEQIFSASGRSSLKNLIRYAQYNQIYVHTVHLAQEDNGGRTPADPALIELTQATGGIYVYYQTSNDLLPLWTRLNEEKQRTQLIYESESAQVDAIQVQVMLPDGSYDSSPVYPVSFPEPDSLTGSELGTTAMAIAGDDSLDLADRIDASVIAASDPATNLATNPATNLATNPVTNLATNARPEIEAENDAAPTSWSAILSGLSKELISVEKGTLLILWALCLGLLFFLVFPEIARSWRLYRKYRHLVWQWLYSLTALLLKVPLLASGSSGNGLGVEPLAANGKADSEQAAGGFTKLGYQTAASNVGHGYANKYEATERGLTVNGAAENASMGREPVGREPVGREPVGNRARLNDHQASNGWDAHAQHTDHTDLDIDATDIQLPHTFSELGRLLRITYDSTLPQEIPILQPSQPEGDELTIYIGRDRQRNTVVIPDDKKRISREHAALILERGLLYLMDNGSVAGTYLNGTKLDTAERKLLREGDRIGFGGVEYQIQLQSEEATVVNSKQDSAE